MMDVAHDATRTALRVFSGFILECSASQLYGMEEKVGCEVEQEEITTGVQQSLGGQERILRESAATEMAQAR